MKRLIGLSLALVFIAYLIGIEVYYSVRLRVAKSESFSLITKHKVSSENTIPFSLTPDQYQNLNWLERNKEFTYNGKHYDIISLQFSTNKISFSCYDDNNETDLVNAFTGFVKHMFSPSNSSSNSNNDLANNFCKEYLRTVDVAKIFFFHVLTTIKADRVLVNRHAPIASIWHPPSLV